MVQCGGSITANSSDMVMTNRSWINQNTWDQNQS